MNHILILSTLEEETPKSRLYLIKTKSVFANFGSEKQVKVKGTFIFIEIDLIEEKQPFLTNASFSNKDKIKILQIKQDIIIQKYDKR